MDAAPISSRCVILRQWLLIDTIGFFAEPASVQRTRMSQLTFAPWLKRLVGIEYRWLNHLTRVAPVEHWMLRITADERFRGSG